MRLLPTGILLLVLVHLVRSDPDSVEDLSTDDLSAAQCDSNVDHLRNKDQENPCQIAVKLLNPCNLTSDDPVQSTTCTCNLVFYNVFCACSNACLQQPIIPYSQWTEDCPGNSQVTDDYPFSNQSDRGGGMGVDIPDWANAQLSGGDFNPVAVFSEPDTKKGWTTLQIVVPIIAVIGAIILGLLSWYMYRYYRRNIRGRKAQDALNVSPFHAGHDRSLSESSVNSTSNLTTNSHRSAVHTHRMWIYFAGMFNTITPVRGKRRNTDWAIDEENAEQFSLDGRQRRAQDAVLEQGLAPSPPPNDDSFSSADSDSSPGSPPRRNEAPPPAWWHFKWLQKLGFLRGSGNRFMPPKGRDYKSSNVSTLPRAGDFRIEPSDCHDAGTGLLEDNDASGSTPVENSQAEQIPPPPRNVANIGVMLISRVPGVNFATSSDEHQSIRHNPEENVQIQSPLQPNRLGNIIVVPPDAAVTNDVPDIRDASPNLSSRNPSPNPLSLPYPAAVSTFGTIWPSRSASHLAPGSDQSSMQRPSIEQLHQLIRPDTTDQTSLFPASVRAAGYSVPNIRVDPTVHSRNVSEPTLLAAPQEVTHDGASSLSYQSNPSPNSSPLPPPAPTLPDQRPPSYSRGVLLRSASEDPAPPYPATPRSPPPKNKRPPHSQMNSSDNLPHSTQIRLEIETRSRRETPYPDHRRNRPPPVEVESPDLENLGSDLLTTTNSNGEMMSAGASSALASSNLLPSSGFHGR